MRLDPASILFEDNHLLVVNKPAGLATQGAAAGEPSLVAAAKEYLRQKYAKPGNVYLGVVSRLDRLVSGVIVLARTSKAADRLNQQFRGRDVRKIYWAVVSGRPAPTSGQCTDWLAKDESQQRVRVVRETAPDAQQAILSYRTLAVVTAGAWLEVLLETGRKHQIRVQLAARGWPILGDRKYGSKEAPGPREAIALHARRLELEHPVRHEPLDFTAPLPAWWKKLGVDSNKSLDSQS